MFDYKVKDWMMGKKQVTAVILNYNSSADCEKCVRFLKNQDYENLSIIVVDNASTNMDERSLLQKMCLDGNVRLIFNSKNKGFSAGNNVGLRAAVEEGAEWMLVINPDVELRDSHYISYVVEQLPKWPEAVVIGTNVVMPNGECQNPMQEMTEAEECLSIIEPLLKKFMSKKESDCIQTGYCNKVSGCCFFVKDIFLKKIGFFDEAVFMYCEEPILAKQVEKLGYKELFLKEVTAYHEHYRNLKEGNSNLKLQEYFKSRIYYLQKYSDYSYVGKKISIIERKIESWLWKNLFGLWRK